MNKPRLSWMKQLGTAEEDAIKALATDGHGNVFIAGYTKGELVKGQKKGVRDAILAKYDSSGNRQWVQQFGTASYDSATALATDAHGNVYVAGHTSGKLGAGTHQGGFDVFLVKYNDDGQQQWLRQFGTSGHDEAFALATDAVGNIFIAGYVSGELEDEQHQGGRDVFLAKYNTSGTRLWVQQFGTSQADAATALATDAHGNVFIAGYTKGELVEGQHRGGRDAFLAKYDGAGNQQWIKQLGTSGYDSATALATDTQGNVYVTLNTDSEMAKNQHSGDKDFYLAKYDGNGIRIWERQLGTPKHDEATALATDANGNIYITGHTDGELTEGQQKGDLDAFLAKYDGNGTRIWELQLGSSEYDYATALATDAHGNLYVAGNTDGEMVAGHGKGGWDAFLAKYVEGEVGV